MRPQNKRDRAILEKYRARFGDLRPSEAIAEMEAAIEAIAPRAIGRPKEHRTGRDEQAYLLVELVRHHLGFVGRAGVTEAQRQCARIWRVKFNTVEKACRRARSHVLSEPDLAFLSGLPSYKSFLKKIKPTAETPRK
jgi:hypothetical protein